MAYSGTVGTTTINVMKLIDHGARRAGKLAEELTSEQIHSAKESLHMFLSTLINKGIQYWAIDKQIIGVTPEKYVYDLDLGAVNALNVLYRQMNRPTGSYASSAGGVVANVGDSDIDTYCQQNAANGNISISYTGDIYAGSIGVLPYVSGGGTASWTFTLEYSTDNVTWNTLEDVGTVNVTDNQWLWYDIDAGQSVAFYRIRAYSGTTLAIRELYVGNNSREIMMSPLNRDDYTNLPNKNFTANQPFQFWFNRTIPRPQLNLWPVPSDPFVQIVVWYSRQIMDVGDLNGELEIPQRWYEAILFGLSHRMALELPMVQPDRIGYLEKMATQYLFEAEQEERGSGPIYFAPNISMYTR